MIQRMMTHWNQSINNEEYMITWHEWLNLETHWINTEDDMKKNLTPWINIEDDMNNLNTKSEKIN